MSDNLRRYRAIHAAILQLFPTPPMGNRARHVQTLVALICGIVGSRHTHVSKIADKVPAQGTKKESRIKRFTRWFANDTITPETYFMPFAATLLQALAHRPVVLVMDGSTVGRGCVALLVSVVYQGRALPLAWTVVPGSTGHFSDLSHCTLLAQVHTLMPPEATVIFLGDGEFDGVNLQAVLTGYGWEYVCRTARNTVVWVEEEWLSFADLLLGRGTWVAVPHAHVTAQAYGPVVAIAVWEAEHSDPLYLVSNMELAEEACFWYRKRFHIETFFSDQKSRGFQIQKSHLTDPARLTRLLMAACLAYLWIVYLGTVAKMDGWDAVIHRTDRWDLSLFQLGLSLLEHFLNEGLPIPVAFHPLDLQVL